MNVLLKITTISLITFVFSCDASKSVADKNTPSETIINSQSETINTNPKMLDEGYSKGTVAYLKDSKCSYIIIDEKTGVKFDPININTKEFSVFKKDTERVYYKYRPLRMANRCNEAQPIEIESIKKRED